MAIIAANNENFGLVIELIGGKVAVKIESSDFDSYRVASTDFSIGMAPNLSSGVVLYYGDCGEVAITSTNLPVRSTVIHLEPSSRQEINYYNDTPIYALADTSLTYNLSISVNSSVEVDIRLYLFNSPNSNQDFINGLNFTYYFKSEYRKECQLNCSIIATVTLNETVFVFAGIIVNVRADVNVAISGQRYEYDPSLLEKKTLYNYSTIEFCHTSLCIGLSSKKHCILANSTKMKMWI